jgi:hypothetical protein
MRLADKLRNRLVERLRHLFAFVLISTWRAEVMRCVRQCTANALGRFRHIQKRPERQDKTQRVQTPVRRMEACGDGGQSRGAEEMIRKAETDWAPSRGCRAMAKARTRSRCASGSAATIFSLPHCAASGGSPSCTGRHMDEDTHTALKPLNLGTEIHIHVERLGRGQLRGA